VHVYAICLDFRSSYDAMRRDPQLIDLTFFFPKLDLTILR
jgi:hypothetical protein